MQESLVETVEPQLERLVALAAPTPRLVLKDRRAQHPSIVECPEVDAPDLRDNAARRGASSDLVVDRPGLAQAGLGEQRKAALRPAVGERHGRHLRN